ncbi:unnamed protein product [Heterobilharzia americana]|nr:unnamed protein product [Heterobilharzia americana]
MEIDLTDESEDVHGPETSYLIEAVGSVLRLYMAEVLMKRPVDPVDYLARCLKKHAQVSDAEMKESVEAVVIEDETHEDEQSISKFGEETEDEVTFESPSKQELNDTPLDGIDDLGDGEADRILKFSECRQLHGI